MKEHQIEIDRGSERNFGITFAVVFLLISGYRYWTANEVLWWAVAVAAVLLVITVTVPSILKTPNEWWFKFGMLLGKVIAPIVMALVYLVALVPMGLLVRLFRKDILRLRLSPETESYWIKRESQPQPMKHQF
jgi:uncharacterized membrane protein